MFSIWFLSDIPARFKKDLTKRSKKLTILKIEFLNFKKKEFASSKSYCVLNFFEKNVGS